MWLSNSGLLWAWPLYWLWKWRGLKGCLEFLCHRGKKATQKCCTSGNGEAVCLLGLQCLSSSSYKSIVTIPEYHSYTPSSPRNGAVSLTTESFSSSQVEAHTHTHCADGVHCLFLRLPPPELNHLLNSYHFPHACTYTQPTPFVVGCDIFANMDQITSPGRRDRGRLQANQSHSGWHN